MNSSSHEQARPSHMIEYAVVEITTNDAAATQSVGEALAAGIAPGQVIALRGDLGAGKTTFVQGLARGLGASGRVSSPTFILVNEYATTRGLRLVHIDAYRLGAAAVDEAAGIGLEEMLDDGEAVVAIEWAELVAELLPADRLLLELFYLPEEEQRLLRFVALGPQSAAALQALQPFTQPNPSP